MALVAALSIEHSLRMLPSDSPERVLIKEDIAAVRSGDELVIDSRYRAAAKRRVNYSIPGLLLQGSTTMLRIAKHRGYPNGGLLSYALYCPREAGSLVQTESYGAEERAECRWQEKNLIPFQTRLFSKVEWGQAQVVEDIRNFKEAA